MPARKPLCFGKKLRGLAGLPHKRTPKPHIHTPFIAILCFFGLLISKLGSSLGGPIFIHPKPHKRTPETPQAYTSKGKIPHKRTPETPQTYTLPPVEPCFYAIFQPLNLLNVVLLNILNNNREPIGPCGLVDDFLFFEFLRDEKKNIGV